MEKHLVFTFEEDGTVEVEAKGFQGKGCIDASKPYEELLGISGVRKLKPEARIEESKKKKKSEEGQVQ